MASEAAGVAWVSKEPRPPKKTSCAPVLEYMYLGRMQRRELHSTLRCSGGGSCPAQVLISQPSDGSGALLRLVVHEDGCCSALPARSVDMSALKGMLEHYVRSSGVILIFLSAGSARFPPQRHRRP